MRRLFLASMICVSCLVVLQAHARIVGYYTSWSIYARNYHVTDIPAEQITHVNYAFANISNGEIALGDYYADVDRFYPGDCWDADCLRGCFHRLQLLKADHPNVKTLISVGGWTWSGQFSDVALTTTSRHRFAFSCAAFVHQYQFDGVDIDWEYPVEGGLPGTPHRPEDSQNFTLLLAALRWQLDSLAQVVGHPYLLTIAASANPEHIDNLEVTQIDTLVDWINIMTYDFHGPWGPPADAVTNFNSPLYSVAEDPTPEPMHTAFSLSSAVQAYLQLGVPPEKLNAGVPFYGRGYGGVTNQNDGLYAAYTNPAPVGTWENGVFDFWDLAANYVNLNGYSMHWHYDAQVPWLYNPTAQVMISYDDSLSIAAKAAYIVQQNLGGAMFWEFSADRNGILLSALHQSLLQTLPAIERLTIHRENMDIHLRWEAVPGATSYQVYRGTSAVFTPEQGTLIAATSATQWNDIGIVSTAQQAHFYLVIAERP